MNERQRTIFEDMKYNVSNYEWAFPLNASGNKVEKVLSLDTDEKDIINDPILNAYYNTPIDEQLEVLEHFVDWCKNNSQKIDK